MSALRCSLCGINYPAHKQFKVCPVHEEETTPYSDIDPDEDWRPRAERLYLQLRVEGTRVVPKVENVPVIYDEGLTYVDHSALYNAGLRLPMGSSFRLFELDGFIWETQGWHESGRRWWVEKVGPALEIADEPPQAMPT